MKKYILFSAFVFIQLLSFSQEKHITFTDSLLINSVNGFDYFKVAESANFDGYFLGSKYDDASFLMKHYVVKTDFKNALLWDTVFYFQEPFSSSPLGITSMISNDNELTVATTATGTNINGRGQPFVYSIDNAGNINWNKYYEIDSLDFDHTNVLKANDGGYMLFGRVSDYSGMALSNQYGFAYKLDAAGVLEWSKLYADKDTTEFVFTAGDLTTDDKYILAGNAYNTKMGGGKPTPPDIFDNFVNVVCVDINGDVLWNAALHFGSPVDNGYGFEVKSVNVMDDQTVLISFRYSNSITTYDDYGLAELNIADGAVNWAKGYSIASEFTGFSLRKVVKKKDGNLVVFYDDYGNDAKSDLLELDPLGNIIQSKSIQEYPSSNTFYQDVIATEDGGLYINATISAGIGLLNFKTDKHLNTHCPEEILFVTPTVTPLTYDVYALLDTIIDVSPFEGTLTPMLDPEISASTDVYCSCELKIDGTIVTPGAGTPADSVLVTLYRYDPFPGQYVKHDTITTDVSGYYKFDYLPEGDYIIKAKPSAVKYPDLLRTYYNSTMPQHQWDSAEVIMMACGNTPTSYNFDLIQSLPQSGSWTCNGYVFEYFGYQGAKLAPGDPIPDIDITVEQSPGGAISSATTDVNGYYQFTGLDNNATFIVRADIPGLPNDSIYTFLVSPGDPALDSLNFYVDTVGVYIFTEDITTHIADASTNLLGVQLMPNPTQGVLNLSINTKEAMEVNVYINNVVGEYIFNQTYQAKIGSTLYPIDLTSYSEGIYFVRIQQGDSYVIKKIIKQ